MAHVAEWKKEEVKELKDLINKYDVVGLVDLENIPAKQLQEMRKSLLGKAVIRMSKINLINLALEDCNAEKTNIVDLIFERFSDCCLGLSNILNVVYGYSFKVSCTVKLSKHLAYANRISCIRNISSIGRGLSNLTG